MDILKNFPSVSKADREAFFEKIFREHKIVPVDCYHVEEIKLEGRHWYRKGLVPVFSTLYCTAYKFGNYMIVWKSCSDEAIFLLEYEQPFEVFSIEKFDFFLRREISAGVFCFERWTWNPSAKAYALKQYATNVIPNDFYPQKDKTVRGKREWLCIYPHEDIETKSVDNTIFYDYIVKFWQD